MICKICGLEIISPIQLEEHFACRAVVNAEKSLEIDTKDIRFDK